MEMGAHVICTALMSDAPKATLMSKQSILKLTKNNAVVNSRTHKVPNNCIIYVG